MSLTIRVMLVDDHELIRTGIKGLLSAATDIQVIAEAGSGKEAVEKALQLKPDIILMDVMMPEMTGLEATQKILATDPNIKIIALTSCEEDPIPSQLLQAGVTGYLTKTCTYEEIIVAIHKAYAGQRYLTSTIAQGLVSKHLSDSESQHTPFDLLSARELQIMEMIIRGEKPQAIAQKMGLSPKTVNTYRYRLFEKLKINSDVELTHLAVRYGLLEPDQVDKK